jgi:hypothetical protein
LTTARRRECGIGAVEAVVCLRTRRQVAARSDSARQVKSRLLQFYPQGRCVKGVNLILVK